MGELYFVNVLLSDGKPRTVIVRARGWFEAFDRASVQLNPFYKYGQVGSCCTLSKYIADYLM